MKRKQEILSKAVSEYADEISVDVLGNLIVFKKVQEK